MPIAASVPSTRRDDAQEEHSRRRLAAGKIIIAGREKKTNKNPRPVHHPLPGVVSRDTPGQTKIAAAQ